MKDQPGDVIKRGGHDVVVAEDAGLGNMQSASAQQDRRLGGFNADHLIAFLIEVGQLAAQRRQNILNAEFQMVPEVRHRVFQVEHHAGRAGVEHLDHQLGVVGRAGHLVALVLHVIRQLDAPVRLGGFRGQPVLRLAPGVRGLEYLLAFFDKFLLQRCETPVQRLEKLAETFRQRRILRRAIHLHAGAGARKAGDVSNHSAHLDDGLEAASRAAVVTAGVLFNMLNICSRGYIQARGPGLACQDGVQYNEQ